MQIGHIVLQPDEPISVIPIQIKNPAFKSYSLQHTFTNTLTKQSQLFANHMLMYLLQDKSSNKMLDHAYKCSKVQRKSWDFLLYKSPER